MRFGRAFSVALVLAIATIARGAGPADELFRLVPADAAATLAVEDLRTRAQEFLESPVAQGLFQLPAFQAWVATGPLARFQAARQKIESALGEKVVTLRDELFGDAVVLTLHVPPGGRPEEASGLVLARVRNRALLDRLVRGINDAERRSGVLTDLTESNHSGVSYWTRVFRPASRKPADHFTVLGDNTFAWSNSRDLIEGAIDRHAGGKPSLAELPKFQQVRNRLPEKAAASLFVAPRFLAQVLAGSARPAKPAGDRAAELIGRYLGAMEYLGVALQWRDGIVLVTEEVLDPTRLDPWVRRWAARTGTISPALRHAPAGALAMASIQVDLNALLDACCAFAPEAQQPRIENLIVALDGILLGRDLRTEIVPHLGPGVLAYLEAAGGEQDGNGPQDPRVEKVLVVGHDNSGGLTAAVENALRTYLAFHALDPHHGRGRLALQSRDVGGRTMTYLAPTTPLAFATENDRVLIGSSAAAVARAITQAANPTEGPLDQLRASRFPQAGSFACVDLVRLHDFVLHRRASLAARLAAGNQRPLDDAGRDVDEVIALMALFRQAYATSDIEPDASAVHRSLGLIPQAATATGRANP
jgi:hypothetical protein